MFPVINGLSDHDAQYLVLNKIFDSHTNNKLSVKKKKRIIANDAIANFLEMLNNESWDNTFHQNDISKSFNSFLITFLNLTFLHYMLPLKQRIITG